VGKPLNEQYAQLLEDDVAALREIGCEVSVCEDRISSLAVIDDSTVWYGSIPLLGFPKSDDCSLRFKSCEVAFDLMQSASAFQPKAPSA
ncbi:MAG: hypothetical protein RR178_07295, partial [Gordonibacter sp.]